MAAQPVTLILQEFAAGDQSALDRLMPLVYAELRKLAGGYLRNERPGHTLQATALVHEAFVKLVGQQQPDYRSRVHFLTIAAHLMRQILTDHARARNAGKRGGGQMKVPIEHALNEPCLDRPASQEPTLLVVDEALEKLAQQRPLRAKLIEMRFFAGLTAEESAEALSLPVQQVRAELRIAQAWLYRELQK